MKVKRLLTYYCSYCKKHGHRKPDMEKHEQHCTLNPNRSCRLCGNADQNREIAQRFTTAKEVWRGIGCPLCEFAIIRTRFPNAINMGEIAIDLRLAVEQYYHHLDMIDQQRY
jgi:hypothetical protein